MAVWTMQYHFRQGFRAPATRAYAWCTDYDPDDLARMGDRGTRRIRWLADDVVILSDRFAGNGHPFTKEKLVHLMPDRLSWTSTHLAGPVQYSQFLYTIQRRGRARSFLDFTGLQVESRRGAPTRARRTAAAEQLRRVDAATWRQLARHFHSDLAG